MLTIICGEDEFRMRQNIEKITGNKINGI